MNEILAVVRAGVRFATPETVRYDFVFQGNVYAWQFPRQHGLEVRRFAVFVLASECCCYRWHRSRPYLLTAQHPQCTSRSAGSFVSCVVSHMHHAGQEGKGDVFVGLC